MKLISLNMEGLKHRHLIIPFLQSENPDVVCLMEAPESFQDELRALGYKSVFAARNLSHQEGVTYTEGVILASKHDFTSETEYYLQNEVKIVEEENLDLTTSSPLISATIEHPTEDSFHVCTTHLNKSSDGIADKHQTDCFNKLLKLLDDKQPHIICGDFNMPRGYNTLYEKMCEHYEDTIPKTYSSSLDRSLHRHGPRADQLDQPIFDEYMVDYLFAKPEYEVSNVRLQFGVSDHAAVIAEVNKK